MIVLYLIIAILFSLIVLLVVRKKFKRSKPQLKKGDYVMLRGKYRKAFPDVPVSHALVIEQMQHGEATVVFMTVKNQILKQTIPLYALARAS